METSKGRISKVTLAPEIPGAIEFIKSLSKIGIIAAIGHTNATEEEINKAVNAGAKMSTHLGNGAHPFIKRYPNYIWAQLANDEIWAGLIADGFHLPWTTLKVMVRTKCRKAILTSDAVNLAGMAPGRYITNLNEDVTLEPNGFLHTTKDPNILAGSATSLKSGIENIVNFNIASLAEAINIATLHPAELFGLQDKGVGKLKVSGPADFIIFTFNNGQMEILETIVKGETVYTRTEN